MARVTSRNPHWTTSGLTLIDHILRVEYSILRRDSRRDGLCHSRFVRQILISSSQLRSKFMIFSTLYTCNFIRYFAKCHFVRYWAPSVYYTSSLRNVRLENLINHCSKFSTNWNRYLLTKCDTRLWSLLVRIFSSYPKFNAVLHDQK